MFLMWYDDDKRKTVTQKISEALEAYERRFHSRANVVLVNPSEVLDAEQTVHVRTQVFIQPSMFYVGVEEAG